VRADAAFGRGLDVPTRRGAAVGGLTRIALIGNALPRLCGLATFTSHIREGIDAYAPGLVVDHYAMVDARRSYSFPPSVTATINQEEISDYHSAARSIMTNGAQVVWVQHEFGIYGGPAGSYLLELLNRVALPVVVTLHTVLEQPDAEQRRVMNVLAARATYLIVMAENGRQVLEKAYRVPSARIAVIPHGVPDRPYEEPSAARARLAWEERPTILTFGLLSPGKGIESMIRAMPAIVGAVPDVRYIVAGATHPHLVATEGEAYRHRLQAVADELGVSAHVLWEDRFLPEHELLDWIAAADVYVTPYANPAQVTSGTLAYAYGLGKPIVATPYVHAAELLSGGSGLLVPFSDDAALSAAIGSLLTDEHTRRRHAAVAYARARAMTWRSTTEQALRRIAPLAQGAGLTRPRERVRQPGAALAA
jgi:glycosyltransferase involved in cell wall biosynthesis